MHIAVIEMTEDGKERIRINSKGFLDIRDLPTFPARPNRLKNGKSMLRKIDAPDGRGVWEFDYEVDQETGDIIGTVTPKLPSQDKSLTARVNLHSTRQDMLEQKGEEQSQILSVLAKYLSFSARGLHLPPMSHRDAFVLNSFIVNENHKIDLGEGYVPQDEIIDG